MIYNLEETRCGDIGNYYGGLWIMAKDGQPFWAIEDYDGIQWQPCPPQVFEALAMQYANQRLEKPR